MLLETAVYMLNRRFFEFYRVTFSEKTSNTWRDVVKSGSIDLYSAVKSYIELYIVISEELQFFFFNVPLGSTNVQQSSISYIDQKEYKAALGETQM